MENELNAALLKQVRTAFEQISDLPLRVHVTDPKGQFLFANMEARAMFGLEENVSAHNIANLYEDEKERRFVLRELKKTTPGEWRKGFRVMLHINGERVKVRFDSKPFFDEKGEILAMLNITESMTRVEWYADFEDVLGVGLFEVNRYLKISDSNQFLAEMLGFESPLDLKGLSVLDFLWEQEYGDILLKSLQENSNLLKEPLKIRRKDGAMALVELSCIAYSLENGEIFRVKGVVKDVTFQVIYDDLPVGLFLINGSPSGQDIFSRVNSTFAKIHAIKNPEDVLGKPSSIFQASKASNDAYIEALDKASDADKPLLDHYMEIKDADGEIHNVVVNVNFLKEPNENIRVGAVYDLTDNVGKHLRTLESDFSALLHTYIATINGLQDTLNNVIKAQGLDVLKDDKQFDAEKSTTKISGSQKHLGTLLIELEKVAKDRQEGLPSVSAMLRHWSKMAGVNSKIKEDDNEAWQRRNLIEMGKSFDSLKNAGLPRELLRNIRFEMNEMLRLTSVSSLSISLNELIARLPEFYYFEKYLRRGETDSQDFLPHNLLAILIDSINFLKDSAAKRKIAFLQNFSTREILVNCNKTSISRALQSLLHNAVKYSWQKGGDNRPWVDIEVIRKQDAVEIIIENWGVPIRKEELENEEIFKFGKRGREAENDGGARPGTGIGLYDAKNIIEKHGGTLRITSEPTYGNPPTLYSKPFITKAFITLPIVK